MYEAIFNYQFYGTMPENLPPIANLLTTAIFPALKKEFSHKSGGRLGKAGAEEIAAKVKELGGKKAAAAEGRRAQARDMPPQACCAHPRQRA